jgi:hypothetical protein
MQLKIRDVAPYWNYTTTEDDGINIRQAHGSIGMYSSIQISGKSTSSLLGKTIYVLPSLYGMPLVQTTPPAEAYQFYFTPGYVSAGYEDMPWIGLPSQETGHCSVRQKFGDYNGDLTDDDDEFVVIFRHVMGADQNGPLNSATSFDESTFLKKDNELNTSTFSNDNNDVYLTQSKFISLHIGVYDADTDTYDYSNITIPWSASFYGQDVDGTVSSTISNFNVALDVSGVGVSEWSTLEDTTVTVTADFSSAPNDYVDYLLFRTDTVADGERWADNVEAKLVNIDGGVNSVVYSPLAPVLTISSATSLTLTSGTTYEQSFDIDASTFEEGATYRLIAVFYDSPPGTKTGTTTSFISDEILARPLRTEFQLQLSHVWRNYEGQDSTVWVEGSVAERIQSEITINESALKTLWTGSAFAGDDLDDHLVGVQVTAYEFGTTVPLAGALYNPATGFSTKTNALAFEVDANASTTTYKIRLRIPESWEDKNIVFEWRFSMTYNDLPVDDPFEVYVYQTRLTVKPLHNNDTATGYFSLTTPLVIQDENGDDVEVICKPGLIDLKAGTNVDYDLVFARKGVLADYNMMTVLKTADQTMQEAIEENHVAGEFSQLGVGYIANEAFSATTAQASITDLDVSTLDFGNTYTLYAVAIEP